MSPMDPKPTLYMKDQDGLVVNNVSSEADPWIVTASISNGVGALVNNLTCSFSGSLCVFENLAIDTMGEGYQLQFELTYPVSSIPAVVSESSVRIFESSVGREECTSSSTEEAEKAAGRFL